MNLECYAVRDDKMEIFQNPHWVLGQAEALRSLTVAVNTPNTKFNQFPEDFSLYLLGSMSEETGEIRPTFPSAAKITTLAALVRKPEDKKNA